MVDFHGLRVRLPFFCPREFVHVQAHHAMMIIGEMHELLGDLDQSRVGTRNLQILQKYRSDQLVNQNPAVLRVVLKFDDIELAVIGLQQVGLSAPAHLADVAARRERHWNEVI